MIGCTHATSVGPERAFATKTNRYAAPIIAPIGTTHVATARHGRLPPSFLADIARNGSASASLSAQNAVGSTCSSASWLSTCMSAQINCAVHSAA